MNPHFVAGIYRSSGGERDRWAVLCVGPDCWYFPKRYGRKAAEALALKLNAGK